MKITHMAEIPETDFCDTCDYLAEEFNNDTKAGKPIGCILFKIEKSNNRKLKECIELSYKHG